MAVMDRFDRLQEHQRLLLRGNYMADVDVDAARCAILPGLLA
jgi:hypothetical protein